MYAHLPRQVTHPPVAARKLGTGLHRFAGVVAAVACGLLASAAIGPAAAFAVTKPVPLGGGPASTVTSSDTTVHVVAAGGMAGWQIAMIALGAALFAAAATFLADRAIAARRAAPATTA